MEGLTLGVGGLTLTKPDAFAALKVDAYSAKRQSVATIGRVA